MANFSSFTGLGPIVRVDYKKLDERNLEICAIRVPVNTAKRVGNEWKQETIWCQVTAFATPTDKFNKAQYWRDTFKQGDYVIISGTPELETFLDKNDKPAAQLNLQNGTITQCLPERMRSNDNQDDAGPAPF